MLTSEQTNQLKQALLEEKGSLSTQYNQEADSEFRNSNPIDSVGELSSYDNHPGDTGTELYEREKDQAINVHHADQVNKIDQALQAIENGSYGTCKTCNKEIPFERLEIVPYTLYCKDHSPDQSVPTDRPVEDELLDMDYNTDKHRVSGDHSVEYDAEDTWQDVARSGTSETPSDMEKPPENINDMYSDEENVGYTEDFENYTSNDIDGNKRNVFNNNEDYEQYQDTLDENGTMTSFGDLKQSTTDHYIEDHEKAITEEDKEKKN